MGDNLRVSTTGGTAAALGLAIGLLASPGSAAAVEWVPELSKRARPDGNDADRPFVEDSGSSTRGPVSRCARLTRAIVTELPGLDEVNRKVAVALVEAIHEQLTGDDVRVAELQPIETDWLNGTLVLEWFLPSRRLVVQLKPDPARSLWALVSIPAIEEDGSGLASELDVGRLVRGALRT
jgi:hypothetical protein